jgi:hypothetical protein
VRDHSDQVFLNLASPLLVLPLADFQAWLSTKS